MKEFISYFSQWNRALPSQVRGASAAEIAELESLVGFPLPQSYRDFLADMGNDLGPANPFEHGDFRIRAVLEFYRATTWRPRERCLLIGRDYSGSGLEFFLEDQADKHAVTQSAAGDDSFSPMILYPSFENMMYLTAFRVMRMAHMAFRATFTPYGLSEWSDKTSGTQLEGFHRIARETGFSLVPRTGRWAAAYQRSDECCLACYQLPGFGPNFSLACNSQKEFDILHRMLESRLALVGQRIR
jgi:hypothetical protein